MLSGMAVSRSGDFFNRGHPVVLLLTANKIYLLPSLTQLIILYIIIYMGD